MKKELLVVLILLAFVPNSIAQRFDRVKFVIDVSTLKSTIILKDYRPQYEHNFQNHKKLKS